MEYSESNAQRLALIVKEKQAGLVGLADFNQYDVRFVIETSNSIEAAYQELIILPELPIEKVGEFKTLSWVVDMDQVAYAAWRQARIALDELAGYVSVVVAAG
jgi:hypothetical protein